MRNEMSEALSDPVTTAKAYVQAQSVLHTDETSFPQGNRDGRNPKQTKGFLWGLVTPLVSFFQVVLSRSQKTAKELIGESYRGIVTSDRYIVPMVGLHWSNDKCVGHISNEI
nr:transposase [Adonisia turfae]